MVVPRLARAEEPTARGGSGSRAGSRRGGKAARFSYELEALAPLAELVEVKARSEDEFLAQAADCDAIITSYGFRISRLILERMERCVVVSMGSVGVDMVDLEAATEQGVVVTNVPDIFIEEVADHTLALLLNLARRIHEVDALARSDQWFGGRPILHRLPRLYGQTLGLIGFGHVARAVTRRALPFGLRVVATDPFVSEVEMTERGVEPVTLDELLERSDWVSMHAPLNEETRGLLGARHFRRMKKTAGVINCARGALIDESALIKALERGQIAQAALDVLEQEPPSSDSPLLEMPNVLLTPHVASTSARKRPMVRRRVGREVALVLSGRWPMSCVNPTVLPRLPLTRWQPLATDRGPNR